MAGNIARKPLEFIMIITVHMVLNGPGQAEVIKGVIGKNITLQFDWNVTVTNVSSFALYTKGEIKRYEYPKTKNRFTVLPNNSVLFNITNLTEADSELYWISLFKDLSLPIKSNEVQLIVEEENSSTTVLPKTTIHDDGRDGGRGGEPSSFPPDAVALLVVTSVVIFFLTLSFFISCLMKTKDQEIEPHRHSNPTVQETISSVEFSINVPGPSLVYSVLDFPKRPPAVVELNPNDTEYASVSYLPEKRHV